MATYVDIDILEKEIRNYADKKCCNGEIELANGILKALSILKEQQTADFTKVVYCKNCNLLNDEYAKQGEKDSDGNPQYYCSLTGNETRLDDYCSKADMKEENNGKSDENIFERNVCVLYAHGNKELKAKLEDWKYNSKCLSDEIAELVKENENLKSKLKKQTVYLRNVSGWCSGCKHFKGLNGCSIGKMEDCTDCKDLYESKF